MPVIVRTAAAMGRLSRPSNPFKQAAKDEPNRLMLLLSKTPARRGCGGGHPGACGRRRDGCSRAGDALWFHYPEGAGTSKLTPSLIDRAVGSPATARNYNTVLKLREMLGT